MTYNFESAAAQTTSTSEADSPFPDFETFVGEIKQRLQIEKFTADFNAVLKSAVQNPVSLYRFFQCYNKLNKGIASTIPFLVGTLGQSERVFLDDNKADYSFKLSGLIQSAATNEFGDHEFRDQSGTPITHRDLAAGLLRAIGNYAGLTEEQRNAIEIPAWFDNNVKKIQRVYSGKADHLEKLAQGIGAHIFSELSADAVEFSNACKALFIDRRSEGFHAYLQVNPDITEQGQTFPAHWWLQTHGGYDEKTGTIHAAEWEHLETGYQAARFMHDKAAPEQRLLIRRAIMKGAKECRRLLDEFFINARKECEKTLEAKQMAISNNQNARSPGRTKLGAPSC